MPDNITIEYVDPPHCDEAPAEPLIAKHPEEPKPNRAQRRAFQRNVARNAALQMRRAYRKYPGLRSVAREERQLRCPRCDLRFLGDTTRRCQCQAQQRHQCAMCHETYMASQTERRFANVCVGCAEQILRQREAEEERRDAAAKRYDEQREWDEEQQREARETREHG